MRELMWLLVTNTAIAIVLALAALLAAQCRRPALAHVIWVLVIVKLLTPPVWRVTVHVAKAPTPVAAPVAVTRAPAVVAPLAAVPMQTAATAAPTATTPMRAPIVIPWMQMMLGLWIGGAIAYLLLAWMRFRSFSRAIRTERQPTELVDEVSLLAARMKIRPPRVIVTPAVVSPMVLILNRAAALVLPAPLLRTLDSQQRRAVIAHELAHLRRGDHFVRWFEMIATAGLWWHPLLWVARWGLRDAEEQCCDAWVVSILPDERRRFADALVDSMEFISRSTLPAAASGLVWMRGGHVRSLKRRLAMIVNRTPPKSLSLAGRMIAAALLVAVPLTPVRGDEQAAPPATRAVAVDDNTRRIIEALLETAQDSNQQVQAESFNAILQFGAKAVPVLIDALEREKASGTAANLLAGLGVDAVDPLLLSMQSPNAGIRESALGTLQNIFVQKSGIRAGRRFGGGYGGPEMGMEGGMLGVAAPEALPPETIELARRLFDPVAKATQDENVTVRRVATTLLSHVAQAKPANYSPQPFVARLSDEDGNVRLAAAQALTALRPADEEVVKALASVIGDRDENVQATALLALAAIGPDAKGATDAVLAALKSANPQLRMMAARALGAMQAKPPGPSMPGVEGAEMMDPGVPGGFGAVPTAAPPRQVPPAGRGARPPGQR